MRFFLFSDQGSREYMEDFTCVANVGPNIHVCGVFDGHGGSEVSRHCSDVLSKELETILKRPFPEDKPQELKYVLALKEALVNIDASTKRAIANKGGVGTTACVALFTPSFVVTANVGDSRAILKTTFKTYDLSKDHKPHDPSEHDRILRLGGYVTMPHQGDGAHRVMGRLSLSRALGDWDLRPYVSSDSDVTLYQRTQLDEFAILASDGIWDVLASEDVGSIVKDAFDSGGTHRDALAKVVSEARGKRSGDNITIIFAEMSKSK